MGVVVVVDLVVVVVLVVAVVAVALAMVAVMAVWSGRRGRHGRSITVWGSESADCVSLACLLACCGVSALTLGQSRRGMWFGVC